MGLRVLARISCGVTAPLRAALVLIPAACGGTSIRHQNGDGGATSGGTGGNAPGGGMTGGGGTGTAATPPCDTLGDYAGPGFVDEGEASEESCAGMTEYCFDPGSPTLETCEDAGAPPSGSGGGTHRLPLPPISLCPSVRNLCRTAGGCCEDIYALVAGPRQSTPDNAGCCYYLAKPGAKGR
jgi:hypothetical protein